MSKIQAHSCAMPGPYAAHCTDRRMHDYSCYDSGEDVSFNSRQDFTHRCDDATCDTPSFVNEGD